jgi:putative transposase
LRAEDFADEEETFFGRADRWGAQAGRGGVPVAELIRKVGISEQTFYRWKKQYVGLESDQVREMKQLQDENSRLKQLVAELSLDKTMLQDVLRKKW